MAFMISRETENVQSAQEVEAAFRALTTGDKPYITSNELFAVSFSHRLISHSNSALMPDGCYLTELDKRASRILQKPNEALQRFHRSSTSRRL